ncbi:MAG: hypothetical protein K2Z81_20080, partial [Cyanobacteria bacterium]|nr:hypothetical protein [Cyanobacteriota bacterium]
RMLDERLKCGDELAVAALSDLLLSRKDSRDVASKEAYQALSASLQGASRNIKLPDGRCLTVRKLKDVSTLEDFRDGRRITRNLRDNILVEEFEDGRLLRAAAPPGVRYDEVIFQEMEVEKEPSRRLVLARQLWSGDAKGSFYPDEGKRTRALEKVASMAQTDQLASTTPAHRLECVRFLDEILKRNPQLKAQFQDKLFAALIDLAVDGVPEARKILDAVPISERQMLLEQLLINLPYKTRLPASTLNDTIKGLERLQNDRGKKPAEISKALESSETELRKRLETLDFDKLSVWVDIAAQQISREKPRSSQEAAISSAIFLESAAALGSDASLLKKLRADEIFAGLSMQPVSNLSDVSLNLVKRADPNQLRLGRVPLDVALQRSVERAENSSDEGVRMYYDQLLRALAKSPAAVASPEFFERLRLMVVDEQSGRGGEGTTGSASKLFADCLASSFRQFPPASLESKGKASSGSLRIGTINVIPIMNTAGQVAAERRLAALDEFCKYASLPDQLLIAKELWQSEDAQCRWRGFKIVGKCLVSKEESVRLRADTLMSSLQEENVSRMLDALIDANGIKSEWFSKLRDRDPRFKNPDIKRKSDELLRRSN